MTILSAVFILITVVWGTYTLIMVQGGLVRSEKPHEEYGEVEPWRYNIDDWAGGRSFWFDAMNYSEASLLDPPPDDLNLLANTTLFIIEPSSPAQLWRSSTYDYFDGQTWSKTSENRYDFTNFITQSQADSYGTTTYRVTLNVTGGSTIGDYELPTLFPGIQVIEDSFRSYPDGLILEETYETDDYGTLLYGPMVQAEAGENVLISYDLTYTQQDLNFVANNARPGTFTPTTISDLYGSVDTTLSQTVLDEISLFESVGTNAYETASAVETYFQTNFDLIISYPEYLERPAEDEEATEWFINRGGGLPYDFASAYCVFMRELGISARPVYGYALGDDFGDHREIMVKHMFFWAEVYIPMISGGEWIQVFPFSFSNELPENTEIGNVQLSVEHYTSTGFPWVALGETFQLSATLYAEGVPTGLGEAISFYDVTGQQLIGTAIIEDGTYGPSANITYAFPIDDPAGPHNITAIYSSTLYTVYAFHNVYAVATPEPLYSTSEIDKPRIHESEPIDIPMAEVIDVNVKLGLDNYTAYWEDTLHVHGLLSHQGQPIDGTTLTNDQMEIHWDGVWYGNATIQSDGTYSLDIVLNPLDLSRMSLGDHWLNSYYAGEFDEETGFPIYSSATSYPSNITLNGKVLLSLTVTPPTTTPNSILSYSGTLILLNGTPLVGESITVYFNGTAFGSPTTGLSGQFSTTYPIGALHPLGIFPANASWASSYPLIASNVSETTWITVSLSTTYLSIDSAPAPRTVVFTTESITIWGQLSNGTHGYSGYDIDVYWQFENLTTINLGPITTNASGYYEVTYFTTVYDEGNVTYWAEFNTTEPGLTASQSERLWIEVRKYYTEVLFFAPAGPYHVTDQITLQAMVYVPEYFGGMGGVLTGVDVLFYWENGSMPIPFFQNYTDIAASGLASYTLTIPLSHDFGNITLYAVFNSIYDSFYGNTSVYEYRIVTNYGTSLSVFSDDTDYYLNETVHVYGQLGSDGPTMSFYTVDMVWDYGNGTTRPFSTSTDALGDYDFYVPLNLGDGTGTISIQISFIPATRLFNGSLASHSINLMLYVTEFIEFLNDTEYHLDEVLEFTGVLRFNDGMIPLRGASITIYYLDGNGLQSFSKITDNGGNFAFYYNFSMTDALGGIYVWAEYLSTNPLWADATFDNESAMLILYQFNLTITTAEFDYHLNESVYVTGYLTYNGTPLQNQPIQMIWDNGTIPVPIYQWYYTDATGFFEFYYNLSGAVDSIGLVDIRANWTNSNPMWANALSNIRTVNIQLYQFNLTLFSADGTLFYHLNDTAHLRGRLTYLDNGVPLANQAIRIYWDNGTVPLPYFESYYTDSNGYFDFYYNFSSTDGLGPISVWAGWTNVDPLWDDANSSSLGLTLQLYQFNLTLYTDASLYYLNQTVHIWGWLRFDANMAGVGGQTITIYWQNGTIPVPIFVDFTDGSGYFEIYYILSTTSDTPNDVNIWAEFLNSNPLWDNATSVPEMVTLQQYQLEINASVPTTVYLDQSLLIQGNVTYQGGFPAAAGVTVNIYLWSGGMWSFVDFVVTDSSGNFQYLYNFTVPPDMVGLYTFRCNTSTSSLYADAVSGNLDVTAQMYSVNLDVYAIPTLVYLNESIFIQVHLFYIQDGTGVNNGEVIIWWYDGTTDQQILTLYTNSSGWAEWLYFGFEGATEWNIEISATFAGDLFTGANDTRTDVVYVTLRPWATEIAGFGSDVSSLNPTETVTIFGALQYTLSGVPISSVDVMVFIDNVYETNVTTLSDGTFYFYWTVEDWRMTGDHDIDIYYLSGVNWIEGASAGPLIITVTRLGLSINSYDVTPAAVYLTDTLTISGQLVLSNGTPYAFVDVELWWNHLSGTAGDELIIIVQTDGSGWFSHSFAVSSGTTLGFTRVWANCTPSSVFIDATEESTIIQISKVPVLVTLNVNNATRYVGDTLSISGTLQRFDLSALVGYEVSLVWQNSTYTIIATLTTTAGGAFSFNFQIPWRHGEGPCFLYAQFYDTDPVLSGNRSITLTLDIWYLVDIYMDEQTVFTLARGDSLTISGYLEDAHGLVPDAILVVYVNGVSVSLSATTGTDGTYSAVLDIPTDTTPGIYTITMRMATPNFDIVSNDDSWTVTIGIEPTLTIVSLTSMDIMAGETLEVVLEVDDDQGRDLTGISVNLYLVHEGSSYDQFLQPFFVNRFQVTISLTIPVGIPSSGNYTIRIEFTGSGNYLATSIESNEKHIFLEDGIAASLRPSSESPSTTFDIFCRIVDENGQQIVGREITIDVNNTGIRGPAITDSNGDARFPFTSGPGTGVLSVSAIMLSDIGAVHLGDFEIQIVVTTPPDWDFMLMLFWIGIIGVEGVVAALVITRFRKRRATNTTYIRPNASVVTAVNYGNHFIRW